MQTIHLDTSQGQRFPVTLAEMVRAACRLRRITNRYPSCQVGSEIQQAALLNGDLWYELDGEHHLSLVSVHRWLRQFTVVVEEIPEDS